jgi:hypothetical protein
VTAPPEPVDPFTDCTHIEAWELLPQPPHNRTPPLPLRLTVAGNPNGDLAGRLINIAPCTAADLTAEGTIQLKGVITLDGGDPIHRNGVRGNCVTVQADACVTIHHDEHGS